MALFFGGESFSPFSTGFGGFAPHHPTLPPPPLPPPFPHAPPPCPPPPCQALEDEVMMQRRELNEAKSIASKASATWDRFRKERDFHRMHHKRVGGTTTSCVC